ncbi:ATP-binding protein [Streptomyces sp. NPDC059155]|uniref:ATP-binding protein n=1 Tax=unclassified Streptomyces TaxID=2593676 RepID=UPI0036B4D5D4
MHEYMSEIRVWGLTCPGFREEVSRARRWTRDVLNGHPSTDDVAVIVTELSANAIRHTASGEKNGAFHITLALAEHAVFVSVADAGSSSTVPRVTCADDMAVSGRGLDMVTTLADRVAIHSTGHGHTVTAELRTQEPEGHPW